MKNWFVYILICADESFYIGYTSDLQKRISEHNIGRGAQHTYVRRPVKLVYQEIYDNKEDALKRESQLKKWSRDKKKALIDQDPAKLKNLSKRKNP